MEEFLNLFAFLSLFNIEVFKVLCTDKGFLPLSDAVIRYETCMLRVCWIFLRALALQMLETSQLSAGSLKTCISAVAFTADWSK